jgi:hypothetical protein
MTTVVSSNLDQIEVIFFVLRFSPHIKTDLRDITEILLQVALNTITLTPFARRQ